jgi:hypothetical protein
MKQEIKKDKEQKGCGECISCLSVCPECGSGDIDVEFKPVFQYYGDIKKSKSLVISRDNSSIKMYCNDCDFEFDGNFDEDNHGFFRLEKSISNLLGISDEYHCEIADDGNLKVTPYKVTCELVGRASEENPAN